MTSLALKGVRPSAIAGTWYPGGKEELRRDVSDYLDAATPASLEGEIVGLIVPHAGYVYSGQVAAYAYRQVSGKSYDTVVVISPIHRAYAVSAGAVVTAAEAYATPLGEVPVHAELLEALRGRLDLQLLRRDDEHSLEIQLPFLQVALPPFKLLPIMVADQSLAFCRRLGVAIGDILSERNETALLVASTDLSHFHNYAQARRLDGAVIERIEAYDTAGLADVLDSGQAEACGGGPVIAVMEAARRLGAGRAQILHQANSGDVTGDRQRVVGYAAGVVLR